MKNANYNIRLGAIFIYTLMVVYAVLCIVFGGSFYRLNILNITFSEAIVFFSLIWYLIVDPRALTFRVKLIFYFIYFYWIAVVIFSIMQDREAYFILRQSVHLFYFLIIPVAYYSLIHLKNINFFEGKSDVVLLVSLIVALIFGLEVNNEHMDGAFVLLIIIFTLYRLKNFYLSLFVAILYIMMTGHASHKLAIIIYFCVVMYYGAGKLKPLVISVACISLIVLGMTPIVTSEFSDANAVWRFLFWKDLVIYMFDNFRLLTGIGYGVPYMQLEYDNFYLLSYQVESGRGEYQLFTVPPHNSILAVFYHLGIVPAIIFLVFIINVALESKRLGNKHEFAAMLAISVIILTHNGLELPYMALLISYVIAIVMSSNYLKRKEIIGKGKARILSK